MSSLSALILSNPAILASPFEEPANSQFGALVDQLTEEELEATVPASQTAESIFRPALAEFSLQFHPRKRLERIRAKRDRGSPGDGFRAISDWIGFRVPCEVSQIASVVETILGVTSDHRGHAFIKAPITKDGLYTDILQFVFVWLPEIDFLLEIQIGHPFAFYTFTVDSILREDPSAPMIDLWDEDFYLTLRGHILDRANGKPGLDSLEITQRTQHLFASAPIPDQLGMILESLI